VCRYHIIHRSERTTGGLRTAKAPAMLTFSTADSNNSYFIAGQSELILMIGEILLIFKTHAVPYCVFSGCQLHPIVVVVHSIVLRDLGVWRLL